MSSAYGKRIVITGFGAVTSAGETALDSFSALCSGQTGIAEIQQWDVSQWNFRYGAELKHYDPKTYIKDRKLLKLLSRHDIVGLYAVDQALQQSELLEYRSSLGETDQAQLNERVGIFVGSTGNRFDQQYDYLAALDDTNGDAKQFGLNVFNCVHPMWLLRILPNNVLAYIGIQYGFKGANQNIVNHAIGGTQAVAEACRHLSSGVIDRAVVSAYGCNVEPEGQIYYSQLGVLSSKDLKPFDQHHQGTILADGAGCLVLETLEAAQARQAKIYGEVIADAVISEAKGVFSIDPQGTGIEQVMQQALTNANLKAQELGMVVAHGNANPASDQSEALALSRVLGSHKVPITGFKWSLGHHLSGCGVIETIMALLSVRENMAPGIANFESAIPEAKGLELSAQHQQLQSPYALLLTRGFGSLNAGLIITA